MKIRQSAVSGMFYPSECDEIKHYIAHFNTPSRKIAYTLTPRALIVPHAGYIYSGFTANLAYNLVASKCSSIKRVIVIGPSHRVYIDGASIALYDTFQTPCGDIDIDLSFSEKLKEKYDFLDFVPSAHNEHSTEVQMPFIQHYFKTAKVIEIVYGQMGHNALSQLIDFLLEDEENLIVISTDLSHFYTQEKANQRDNICLDAIKNLSIETFEQGGEACGLLGVKALIQSSLYHQLKPHLLDYRTSFDRTGDESNVVGYTSFVFGK